jgi:hypothetical protein
LELRDVRPGSEKSIGCLCRHHGIHQLKRRQLCFSKYGLEERLWHQTTAIKINLSFVFILRNVETGQLRYYHSSQNNSRFFDVPHLIRTEEDLERFLEELSRHDMLEYIRQQRPDTKWVVHLLTNVTFYE